MTLTPWTTTDWARTPLKLSPTLLFLALTVCCMRTTTGVPAGTVYCLGGGGGAGAAAATGAAGGGAAAAGGGGGGGRRGRSRLGGGGRLCRGGCGSRAFIASAQQQQPAQSERKHARI